VTAGQGGGVPTTTVFPASLQGAAVSTPDNGGAGPQGSDDSAPPQHPDPAPWMTPSSGNASASPPGGQQGGSTGHPDPAPWHPTTTLHGSTAGTGGSSASAASGGPDPLDGEPGRLPASQR
jgi:hypothetical protein